MQETAFITVVTVPRILAQAETCSLQVHFSLHVGKLLRELKFCRSITSGAFVPVVQFELGTLGWTSVQQIATAFF